MKKSDNSRGTTGSAALAHILAKTREAYSRGGPGPLSTGEALVAALVLNRPDWLIAMNYTIAEALDRVGAEWAKLIPAAANHFKREIETAECKQALEAHTARLAEFADRQKREDERLEFAATFVTSGSAPGYRDVYLTLDLEPIVEGVRQTTRVTIGLRPEDGETVVSEILQVHRLAWRNDRPIDARPDEQRPRWLDKP